MKVALVQTALYWENPKENKEHFTKIIAGIKEAVDLIVLPEMFTTGFTMNPRIVAESMNGATVQWMKDTAHETGAALVGSLIIEENSKYYNRLVFVAPSGEMVFYDKRHLFTLAGEDRVYTRGLERQIIHFKGFKICPLICYDLRFPVFSRNSEDYDLLLYVANWPAVREKAWEVLLQARAIENQCFVIGVNRVGEDDNQHVYSGHSQAIDILGNYLLDPQDNEGVFVVELNREEMLSVRKKLNFLSDQDRFTLSE